MKTQLALIGGGLANCLIAFRLSLTRPDIDLRLIERGATLGGNHTWSFHRTDVSDTQYEWITPLVAHSWSGYEVRFPRFTRVFDGGYHSLTADVLHRIVLERLGERVLIGAEVEKLSHQEVRLRDGRTIVANAVIDGRGAGESDHLQLGFQKFVGQVVELAAPHGMEVPVLMDATVPQIDGFRFVYTLPFAPRLVLIEDTRYSDTPAMDRDELAGEIRGYAEAQGWRIRDVTREERGVLPIVMAGDVTSLWDEGPPGVARSGMRAALFHHTTGYSLPDAVRLADRVAEIREIESRTLYEETKRYAIARWRRQGFFRLLSRMLFVAADPPRRYEVLQRFYRLRQPLIERFYAGRLTIRDKARILFGRPPVPIRRAIRCFADRPVTGR